MRVGTTITPRIDLVIEGDYDGRVQLFRLFRIARIALISAGIACGRLGFDASAGSGSATDGSVPPDGVACATDLGNGAGQLGAGDDITRNTPSVPLCAKP